MQNNLQNTEAVETRTYSQEEVNELLQKEGDRRVTEALKKQEKKLSEQNKLAMMNEQEKFQYQLEQREKAIAEKEEQLAMAEMRQATSAILAEKGLPVSLTDIITSKDAEATKTAIQSLEKAFKEAVKSEVEKRIGSAAPKVSETAQNGIDSKTFSKMSLSERAKLAQDSPEIYNNLMRR